MKFEIADVELLLRHAGWATMRWRTHGHSLHMRTMDYGAVDDFSTAYGYTAERQQSLPPDHDEMWLADQSVSWLARIPDPVTRRVVAMRMLWNGETGKYTHSYRSIALSAGVSVRAARWLHHDGMRLVLGVFVESENISRLETLLLENNE